MFKSYNAQVKAKLKEGNTIALKLIALSAEAGVIEQITENKSVDTGRLRNSINSDSDDLIAVIGTNVEYAIFVDQGTSKQQSKPFMLPGVLKKQSIFKSLMIEAYRSVGL